MRLPEIIYIRPYWAIPSSMEVHGNIVGALRTIELVVSEPQDGELT